jgi:hypothetical protein
LLTSEDTFEVHATQMCHAGSVGDDANRPVVQIWRLPDCLTFDSVNGKLEDLGYRPVRARRTAFRPSAAATIPILLYMADAISGAAAAELVRAVAEWARGKLRRRKGGTKVVILSVPTSRSWPR